MAVPVREQISLTAKSTVPLAAWTAMAVVVSGAAQRPVAAWKWKLAASRYMFVLMLMSVLLVLFVEQ